MNAEPQSGTSNGTCLPEDLPVPRPEEFIGRTVGPDHRIERIEAIGSKFVVFALLNLRTGEIDQVAKVPREEFDPQGQLLKALPQAITGPSSSPDRVIRICDRLLALDPTCEAAAFNKGVAMLEKKEPHGALLAFNMAISLQPRDPWNLIHRATCFAALGRDAEALHDLQAAAGLNRSELKRMLAMVPRNAETISHALRRLTKTSTSPDEARQALRAHFSLVQRFGLWPRKVQ